MNKVLIIGAGGVGRVTAYKCAQQEDVFGEIHLANKTMKKCRKLRKDIREKFGRDVKIHQVDAEKVQDITDLMNDIKPDLAVNVALPYQNIPIMRACLAAGANYMDTAISEERGKFKEYDYKYQRAFDQDFRKKGLIALLGCGFDPGATNVMCAYAQKNLFDRIKTIDILDCNAGNHGQRFMPNFNVEINLREVSQPARIWEKGKWIKKPKITDDDAVHFTFDYPVVGKHDTYTLFHEEMMSLVKYIKGLERMRFGMTFTKEYLKYLSVYDTTGLLGCEPVKVDGQDVIPMHVLQKLLPKSGEVADNYTGKTAIGCIFDGINKEGKRDSKYMYQICDHRESFEETGIHAIAFTTGVPAAITARLITDRTWKGAGVYHPEQFDPDPFMERMAKLGLPWKIEDGKKYLKMLPK